MTWTAKWTCSYGTLTFQFKEEPDVIPLKNEQEVLECVAELIGQLNQNDGDTEITKSP